MSFTDEISTKSKEISKQIEFSDGYDKFQKLKVIEDRIIQLEILKKYIEGILKNKPLDIKLELSFSGEKSTDTWEFPSANYLFAEEEDSVFILEMIQNRIDELKKHFEL